MSNASYYILVFSSNSFRQVIFSLLTGGEMFQLDNFVESWFEKGETPIAMSSCNLAVILNLQHEEQFFCLQVSKILNVRNSPKNPR